MPPEHCGGRKGENADVIRIERRGRNQKATRTMAKSAMLSQRWPIRGVICGPTQPEIAAMM